MPGLHTHNFASRHIGPRDADRDAMLRAIGAASIDELIDQAIPRSIRLDRPLDLPEPLAEHEFLDHLRDLASRNRIHSVRSSAWAMPTRSRPA